MGRTSNFARPMLPTYRGSSVQENICTRKPKKNEQAISIVDCLFTSCRCQVDIIFSLRLTDH